MKAIQFTTVQKLQDAVDLLCNVYERGLGKVDPDLDFSILANESTSGYSLEVSYNSNLKVTDFGPTWEEQERESFTLNFDFYNTDKELEEMVTDILNKLSQIKLAA